MLTPADIEQKKFKTTRVREGYDQDEVDAFLDAAGEQLQQAIDEINTVRSETVRVKAQLATVQRQLDTYGNQPTQVMPVIPEFLGDVTRILGVAQQTADQEVAEAKYKAERATSEAEMKAKEIISKACSEAEQAKSRAQSEVFSMQGKLGTLKEQHDSLKMFLTEHLTALQGKLEERSGH